MALLPSWHFYKFLALRNYLDLLLVGNINLSYEVQFCEDKTKRRKKTLPDPYRQDLAFLLFNAEIRRPNDRTKANIPFANLHEG